MNRSRPGPVRRTAARLLAPILAINLVAVGFGATQPVAAASTGTLSMQFDGYAHGLIALKMAGELSLDKAGYSGRLTMRTAGMINWLSHMDSDSTVRGHFTAAGVDPTQFDSTGTTRGAARAMHILYEAGAPTIVQQEPAVDDARTQVPSSDSAGTIDTLSAIALLVRQVAERGTCDGAVRLFDGRRVTALTAHTAGYETLSLSGKTRFNGRALRCDFDGVRVAGFVKTDDMAQQRRTRHGSAWLAPLVPGAPPVPVKVVFDNKALGQVTLYLTNVTGSPGAVAQNAAGLVR